MSDRWRVAEVVEIASGFGEEAGRCVRTMIRLIDGLHLLPRRRRVRIEKLRRQSGRRVEGIYRTRGGESFIGISEGAREPHLTLAHEFGHYLDDMVLHPVRGIWASHYDDDFVELLQACLDSMPLVTARRLAAARRVSLSVQDRRDLQEFQWPHEMFARAYAQWVAQKSVSPVLMEEWKRRAHRIVPGALSQLRYQWEREEFDDIMAAVDRLFGKKGLL